MNLMLGNMDHPAAPIQNFKIPEGMRGDWWNDFLSPVRNRTSRSRICFGSNYLVCSVASKIETFPFFQDRQNSVDTTRR